MIKRFAASYLIAGALFAAAMTACNENDNNYQDDYGYTPETMYSSTAVTSFNIKPNSKLLANLDSVFFTIDLNRGLIFNADSLPKDTKITKLVPNIGTSGSSKIELIVKGSKVMKDTTFVYTTSFTDSIDFSANVMVRVTSLNEKYTGNYQIKVNVHKLKPDSLHWSEIAWKGMPGNPIAQKTVVNDERVYTFMETADGYKVWIQDTPGADGEVKQLTFTSSLDVKSVVAGEDIFYALNTNGVLHSSHDGIDWTAQGEQLHHIYGVYDGHVIAVRKDGAKYFHTTYPHTGTDTEVSADCPISGTSPLVQFENKWMEKPLALTVGGRTANGTLTGAAWGYDGAHWAKVSATPIKGAYQGMTLFPYFTFRTSSSSWKVTEYSTIFAMGGVNQQGYNTRRVFISRDQGLNWSEADDLLSLPDYIPETAFAQAIVWTSELHSRSLAASSDWNETAARPLPAWWIETPGYGRATKPVTSWECPYIYLYGGILPNGQLNPQVWRGVINRLTFKPLE